MKAKGSQKKVQLPDAEKCLLKAKKCPNAATVFPVKILHEKELRER